MHQPLNKKLLSFLVAITLAIAAGTCAGGIFLYRDYFFSSAMEPAGKLELGSNDALFVKAQVYAQKKLGTPGSVCVSRWLGKDNRFVYLAFGCAKFTLQYGEWHAFGDPGFRALRLRHLWGKVFFGLDEGDPEDMGQSLRRLYPTAINDLWWKQSSSSEYMSAGVAKTKPL
jgi:hypothetical protein